MSKNTAPKKNPTQLDRIEALAKSAHAEAGLAHAATIALQQRIDAMRHEQVALSQESRSAPAEEWPKLGDHIILIEDQDTSLKKGEVCEVLHVGKIDAQVQSLYPTAGDGRWWVGLDRIRPATEAEVASHKAKEEQRAKEAGWAKYDVLQELDACAVSRDQQLDLINKAEDAGIFYEAENISAYPANPNLQFRKGKVRRCVGVDECFGSDELNWLPVAEFLRRLQGTIAKRAEDERAKELAKPLTIGMKVRTEEDGEGFYWFLNDSPSDGFHRIILPKGNVATLRRHEFQIID